MFHQSKKKSKFSFRLIENFQDLRAENYHGDVFYAQCDFLKHSSIINPQVKHVVIEASDGQEVLANFYFQIMPFKGSELKSYIPQGEDCIINKTVEAIVDLALERVNWNLAVLGNVFVTGDNGQFWRNKKLASEIKWEIVEDACNFLGKHTNADAFLISDLRQEDLEGHQYMIDRSFRFFEVEPDLIFDIDSSWNNFDDYLASVVSKYRVRTKKVLKKSQEITVRDLSIEDIKINEDLIYSLYKNVVDSVAFKLAEVDTDYFKSFKQAFPHNFFVRGFYLNDQMVGMISFFEDETFLLMNFIGLNYSLNREHCVYQRILYDSIEQGIIRGKKHIHFGRTATEIKTSVGAKPVKAFSLLKHSSKITNKAIKPLTTYLKPEPFEVRKPFKDKVQVAS